MLQVYYKEINSFFNSFTAYLVVSAFLTTMGLLVWIFPDTSILNYGFADMDVLFTLAPYVFMFLVPAITMRMFAEEKKSGTMELLLTRPLTDYQIVLGKYFAGITLVFFSLLPTLIYYGSIWILGSPAGNIDTPGITGSYIGLFLLGCVFTSLGLFGSSLSENQVIAFIISVFLCFILYEGFSALAKINVWGSYASLFSQLSITSHYNDLGKGLIDMRDITYFLSVIIFMLMITKLVIGSRKWE